ncbi:PTS sugar transporter subunit IIC [Dendrosporobacter sp. 1207_IL3150]|uniref:PTS sugar transporter subunit IIC n=1 Tax=Dendrosporobacter sp. 1207_IL3150 TaxID=3084054 RepID=UPI002FD993A3
MNSVQLVDIIANQRHIAAVRRAVLLNIPIFVIGAFSTMLSEVTILWYQQLMLAWFGANWSAFWHSVTSASLNGISISLVLSISYFLCEKTEQVKRGQVHPLAVAIVSFACYLTFVQTYLHNVSWEISFSSLGVGCVFCAIVTAIISTEIFLFLLSINKLNIELFTDIADPILQQVLSCIIPAIGTIVIIAVLNIFLVGPNIEYLNSGFYNWFAGVIQEIESPLAKMIVLILLIHVFWFLGLHGSNIMEPFLQYIKLEDLQMIYKLADGSNIAGEAFTKTLMDSFVLIGGAGSTICLMLALYLVSRRGNMAWLTKLSIVPAIFNINEILIFGLPIVLNPIFLIPFITVPLVLTCVSYSAISTGLISIVVESVHWTTPPFISGYIATNSWSGVALQIVQILIGSAIYLPFIIINEKQKKGEI